MTAAAFLEVNGETVEYPGNTLPVTVMQLVESLGIDPRKVVAEVNGDIVGRGDFADHALASGDKVELVRFVGGG